MKKMLAFILMFGIFSNNNYFINLQAFFNKPSKQNAADIKAAPSKNHKIADRMLELEQEIQSQIQVCTMI